MHNLNDPSALVTNTTGAPHSDTLRRMNPFCKRSSTCTLNSCCSLGAIRLRGITTGLAPSTRSIRNSISLCGGNPLTSSKTSSNPLAIGTDDSPSRGTTSEYMKLMKTPSSCLHRITIFRPSTFSTVTSNLSQSTFVAYFLSQSISKIISNPAKFRTKQSQTKEQP